MVVLLLLLDQLFKGLDAELGLVPVIGQLLVDLPLGKFLTAHVVFVLFDLLFIYLGEGLFLLLSCRLPSNELEWPVTSLLI